MYPRTRVPVHGSPDAKRWHVGLIIVGTHGHRGFRQLLMGSDAERALCEGLVPVLLYDESRSSARTRKRVNDASCIRHPP
ncbi:MAG: universal stress protein [Burkholderiales bacterium]